MSVVVVHTWPSRLKNQMSAPNAELLLNNTLLALLAEITKAKKFFAQKLI